MSKLNDLVVMAEHQTATCRIYEVIAKVAVNSDNETRTKAIALLGPLYAETTLRMNAVCDQIEAMLRDQA